MCLVLKDTPWPQLLPAGICTVQVDDAQAAGSHKARRLFDPRHPGRRTAGAEEMQERHSIRDTHLLDLVEDGAPRSGIAHLVLALLLALLHLGVRLL